MFIAKKSRVPFERGPIFVACVFPVCPGGFFSVDGSIFLRQSRFSFSTFCGFIFRQGKICRTFCQYGSIIVFSRQGENPVGFCWGFLQAAYGFTLICNQLQKTFRLDIERTEKLVVQAHSLFAGKACIRAADIKGMSIFLHLLENMPHRIEPDIFLSCFAVCLCGVAVVFPISLQPAAAFEHALRQDDFCLAQIAPYIKGVLDIKGSVAAKFCKELLKINFVQHAFCEGHTNLEGVRIPAESVSDFEPFIYMTGIGRADEALTVKGIDLNALPVFAYAELPERFFVRRLLPDIRKYLDIFYIGSVIFQH